MNSNWWRLCDVARLNGGVVMLPNFTFIFDMRSFRVEKVTRNSTIHAMLWNWSSERNVAFVDAFAVLPYVMLSYDLVVLLENTALEILKFIQRCHVDEINSSSDFAIAMLPDFRYLATLHATRDSAILSICNVGIASISPKLEYDFVKNDQKRGCGKVNVRRCQIKISTNRSFAFGKMQRVKHLPCWVKKWSWTKKKMSY